MSCILKSLYYDDDQISNVSIVTEVSVMQVECWIDSAKVPNVSIVLTFGLTSNEDTSPCSPTLGGGTALAAGCCWPGLHCVGSSCFIYLGSPAGGWWPWWPSTVQCFVSTILSDLCSRQYTVYLHNIARIHYLYTLQGSNV